MNILINIALALACLYIVGCATLFTIGVVRGFKQARRRTCAHQCPATFRLGPDESVLLHHCFTCGCTRVNEHDWHDYGIRSGNELNEFIAEVDEELTPHDAPENAGDAMPNDMPPPMPLNARVLHLLQTVRQQTSDNPNAVVLGRAELQELYPIVIAGLERCEQFRVASRLKLMNGDVDAPLFLRALRSLQLHRLTVVPSLENDSIIALTTV